MAHKQVEAEIFYCDFAHPWSDYLESIDLREHDLLDLYVTLPEHVALCVERDRMVAELAEARELLREAYNAHAESMTVGLCYRLAHFLGRPYVTGTIGNIYGASSMPEGK